MRLGLSVPVFILVSIFGASSPVTGSSDGLEPLIRNPSLDPSDYVFIINGTDQDVRSVIENLTEEIRAAVMPFIPPGSPICIDGGAWDPKNPAFVDDDLRLVYISVPSPHGEDPTNPSSGIFFFVHPNMDGECLDPDGP